MSANTPDEYIDQLPEERKVAVTKLRNIIKENLPKGFEETISYGMLSYVVPHSLYPAGYHVDKKQPLPFLSIASQKNHIAVYHMAMYSDEEILHWFKEEYPKHSTRKLDMGKSCIRFKKAEQIPYELLSELLQKITVEDWIRLYEKEIKKG